MENLGQNSRPVHRAYSRKAKVEMPALSEYEKLQKAHIATTQYPQPASQAVTA
jgi:hypothetical protein